MIERLIKIIVNSPTANDKKKIYTIYNCMNQVFGQTNNLTEALKEIPEASGIGCEINAFYLYQLGIRHNNLAFIKGSFYGVLDYV